MWDNFYQAGGWGMYPTSLFGFFLLAGALLFALRPELRLFPALACLAIATTASGLLGCTVGVVKTFHYLPEVPAGDQFLIATQGCAESLNNLVLALILLVLGALVTLAGAVRATRSVASPAGAT